MTAFSYDAIRVLQAAGSNDIEFRILFVVGRRSSACVDCEVVCRATLNTNSVVSTYAFAKLRMTLHATHENLSQCTVFLLTSKCPLRFVIVSALFGPIQYLEGFLHLDGFKPTDSWM